MAPVDWPTRDLLAHRVAATPDRTALVDADAGESWTYRALDDRVEALAGRLAGRGVGPDDRAGVLAGTRPAFVDLVHAAARLTAVLVPLDVRLTAAELRPRLAAAGVDLLVCEADTEGLAVDAADCPVVSLDETERERVSALPAVPSAGFSADPVARDRTQVVAFTSGTTGEPKGVRLTAGNLVASTTASAFRLGVDPGDRWLVPLPTYHVGGLAPILRSALYGTAVVLQREFDADETARVVDEYDVTCTSMVPTMLGRLLDAGWDPPERLRFVLLGGAPADEALLDRCEERGVPVCPTYGLTEAASQVATARPGEATAHPGTVGQPLVFTDVAVVDEDGEPCAAGTVGELVVSGPTVTPGYLDDERTEAAFGDRGLHTGDAGYRDADGRLWVVGRLDDRIVTGGENVQPGEVVAVLRDHPGVADAAVVGLPDPEWGERVAALVVPAGDDRPGAADLAAFCDERLAGYKRPRTWGFVGALPRTASGTVDRDAVREALLASGRRA